ncbi:MAG: hypothetical protein KDK38_14155 [Leptospiraceae bacterium]|nr:hypothetical protein [Leptospiraceae bacterium]
MKNRKLWFRAKYFGWGWYPASWEGWAVTLGFVLFQYGNYRRLEAIASTESELQFFFLIETVIAALILIQICYTTGEKPQWRFKLPKPPRKQA